MSRFDGCAPDRTKLWPIVGRSGGVAARRLKTEDRRRGLMKSVADVDQRYSQPHQPLLNIIPREVRSDASTMGIGTSTRESPQQLSEVERNDTEILINKGALGKRLLFAKGSTNISPHGRPSGHPEDVSC